jgi:EAL domain-containing protein (putative c-di-GMP-specific phosphodiesterase class I)
MTSLYSHWLVGLSVVVAVLVSYTALRLAARVAASEGSAARIWLGIGAVVSSMSYLRRFPIDKLKIDRSFINDLTTSADAASIVKAIISLAQSLRLKVVAEGVETAEQLQRLRDFGCDQFQGFYRSQAVFPAEIEKFVQLAHEEIVIPDKRFFMETRSKLAAFRPR